MARFNGTERIMHETTYEQRATWGECPVCHAQHGEPCDGNIGFALGTTASGERPIDGAHLGRLQNAPKFLTMIASN